MTLQPGIEALNQGRFEEAERLFVKAVADPAVRGQAAPFLCFSLIEQNKTTDLSRFLTLDSERYLFQKALLDALLHYGANNRLAVVTRLGESATPDQPLLRLLVQFVTGCAKALPGDTDGAAAAFHRAHALATRDDVPLDLNPGLREIFLAGWNMEDDAFISTLEADRDLNAMKQGGITETDIQGAPAGPGYVLFSSCDEKYLDAHVPHQVQSLETLGDPRTLHLNIVDGSAACAGKISALRETLKAVTLNYSIERAPDAVRSTTYLACSRFVIAPEIMTHYDRNLLITDVDIFYTDRLRSVADAVQDADVGYYFFDNVFPWLRHFATAVYVGNTANGRRYLNTLGNYCLRKLRENRYWTLDQSAMYCLYNALPRLGHSVAIRDMTSPQGAIFNKQENMDARKVRDKTRSE